MAVLTTSALADLRWLVRDQGSGEVELRDDRGERVSGTLEPGYGPLFAPDRAADLVVTFGVLDANGSMRVFEAMPVPGHTDLAVAIDVSGRDRAIAPIVETLVNQVAHDVRNYAFTIGLQAELGDRRAEAQPEVRGHFASVLRQVDTLRAYLDKLLLYGRPVTLRPTNAEAGAIVRQQVQALQFGWRPDAPPLTISVSVNADAGEVRWDIRSIGSALLALLDNAVRSAEPPPPVSVTVTRAGQLVTIEIADTGAGIPDDKLDQVWSPMRVRRHGGTGLGLAIARKMVTAHGGTIDLSTGAGGTTVRLRLPAEVAAG
jgi:two-component system OmpR family sensor kinase